MSDFGQVGLDQPFEPLPKLNHLLALAQTNGVSRRRVNDVIEMVGLDDVAGKRIGGFSLGMGQRLGIASALPPRGTAGRHRR